MKKVDRITDIRSCYQNLTFRLPFPGWTLIQINGDTVALDAPFPSGVFAEVVYSHPESAALHAKVVAFEMILEFRYLHIVKHHYHF